MKAIVYREYGPPDVLKLEDIEKPIPKDDEVLLKVRAASANPVDWHFMRGLPYLVRIAAGLTKPKRTQLGMDVAGEVESIGSKVTQFKPGDPVFGSCHGAFAEFACASETKLAIKPQNITFEQAASVPVASYTALQGLRDKAKIPPGQQVLINGAAGGVGTFAVQIAKSFGANVTGVCSTKNIELVRSIAADRVIDYTKENFTEGSQRYDAILDCIGNHSISAIKRILNPKGTHVAVGGRTGKWMLGALAQAVALPFYSRIVGRNFVAILARANQADLITMHDLMKSGKVVPVIDRTYPLSETSEAIRYLETGHAHGKVVSTM
jgi:NADPH:quinone reductase-like Zn-dependent oxidoreductase